MLELIAGIVAILAWPAAVVVVIVALICDPIGDFVGVLIRRRWR